MNTSTTKYPLIAKTAFGLEEVLAAELRQINAQKIDIQTRAVAFEGDLSTMYNANLRLRTALRILKPIRSFIAEDEDQLYKEIGKTDWSAYFGNADTFAIDSAVHSELFSHSKFISLKAKDAIVDQFRAKTGERPSIDIENPTIRLNLRISRNECTIALDSSGSSLHKRGYRLDGGMAPLNEVLAAGMIALSGYDGTMNIVDPMCGSGTLLIEAAMVASKIVPQKFRDSFGFMNWSDYDADLWKKIRSEAADEEQPAPKKIMGFDKIPAAIYSSRGNVNKSGFTKVIELKVQSFAHLQPPEEGGLIIMNPPYGERMELDEVETFYKMIGNALKQNCSGYDAWILSSNKDAMKQIGLQTSKRLTLFNGALECKFHKYSIYKGSKKVKNNPEE